LKELSELWIFEGEVLMVTVVWVATSAEHRGNCASLLYVLQSTDS